MYHEDSESRRAANRNAAQVNPKPSSRSRRRSGPPGSGQLRSWVLAVLCLSSGASAQVPYVGVLSAVDIGARPGVEKEAGRAPGLGAALGGQEVRPLVELIHVQNLVACRSAKTATKVGSLQTGPAPTPAKCPQYEYSAPFLPEADAMAMEEELSRAWNEFDARSTWYMNSLLNSNPDPGNFGGLAQTLTGSSVAETVRLAGSLSSATKGFSLAGNCGANAQARSDRYINAWDAASSAVTAKLGVPIDRTLFCDDLKTAVSAVPSYLLTDCIRMNIPPYTNWVEVGARLARGYTQAVSVYYPQYWLAVYAAIEKYMPGSLAWDGVYPLTGPAGTVGGAQLQPVYADAAHPELYRALALKAQTKDLGGASYMLKSYPYPALVGGKPKSVATLPGITLPGSGGLGSRWPGNSALEVLKYGLSKREDIFSRADQWWSLNPKVGPEPQGTTGAGDLRETEGVGAVSFIELYSKVDALTSPRPVEYKRWCLLPTFIPWPVLITVNFPTVAQQLTSSLGGLTRVHVRWETVPEGYPLHSVKGQPTAGVLGLRAQLAGLLPKLTLPTLDAQKMVLKQTALKAVDTLASTAAPAFPTGVTPKVSAPDLLQKPNAPANSAAVPGKTAPTKTTPLKTTPGKTVPVKSTPLKTVPSKTVPSKTVPSKTTPGKGSVTPKNGGISYSQVKVKPGVTTQKFGGNFASHGTTTQASPTRKTVSTPTAAVKGCEKATGTEALRKCLAMKILKTSRISLSDVSSTRGGSPEQNMVDTARGLAPMRGCGPEVPNCSQRHVLSIRLLEAMLKMAKDHQYFVTALTGGGHGEDSKHYLGEAIDLGTFDGIFLGSGSEQGHRIASDVCISAGSRKGQTFNIFHDTAKRNHRDHVHCDFHPE
jgi:hypothetical protein